MNDKNGERIWDGDYVVAVTKEGEVVEGIVTGKDYTRMMVCITNPDTGEESWVKNYRTEIQIDEEPDYELCN